MGNHSKCYRCGELDEYCVCAAAHPVAGSPAECPVCTNGRLKPLQMHFCDTCGIECATTEDAKANVLYQLAHERAAPVPASEAVAKVIINDGNGTATIMLAPSVRLPVGTSLFAAPAAPTDAKPDEHAAVNSYKLGTWFDARTLDEMQAFYLSRLPAIRKAAHEHGYAIGLHGSERRDFDLMAMQWRDGASDKDTLAHAVAVAACGITRDGAFDWEKKPSGRFAVSLPICWTDHNNPDFDKPSMGHIDLSLLDPAAAQSVRDAAQPTIAAEDVRDAARLDHIAAKHVMGASYCGITSLNVIVHMDDYAKGGARYAIDCQMEREGARAIATPTPPSKG